MRTSRENINYAPVDRSSSESPKMDPLGTSKPEAECLLTRGKIPQIWSNTITNPDGQTIVDEEGPDAQRQKVEHKEPKINWKQIMGCLSANSINLTGGAAMSVTSSLIPALLSEDSDLKVTEAQSAWIASVIPLASPFGALFSAFLMERIGRLATVQATTLPFCLAWVVVAVAPNIATLLVGRTVMGFMFGLGVSPANVLTTETALKKYRGPLACTGITFASLGILLGYIIGAMVDWRTAAWICMSFPLLSLCLNCLFTAESPLWLRSRGRIEAARRTCSYYYGDPSFFVQTAVPRSPPPPLTTEGDFEKAAPEPATGSAAPDPFFRQLWLLVSRPSGYKPLLILDLIFLLQQMSGIYITLYYAVLFFQTAGSPIDPYIATILIGAMRFLACGMAIFLFRVCSRRKLMIVGSLGMAICMAGAGYSTNLVLTENGGGDPSPLPSWFPVACVIIYICAASIGLQTIPWTMTAELFPQRVRGAAQAVNVTVGFIFMFLILQAYPIINLYLGGAVGVQYAFAVSSLLAAVICWVFQPETHGKTLTEIEDYFVHNTIFLGRKK